MLSIGLAHLKLDQVKRRKGARGKENAKRRRNTWIVTTRAIPTVMLQEVLEKYIFTCITYNSFVFIPRCICSIPDYGFLLS